MTEDLHSRTVVADTHNDLLMAERGLDETTIRAVLGGNVQRLFREQLGSTR
ncbi:hypothetical protein ACWGH2_27575 [Streptomyces sp. NPDC054871]